MKNLSDYIDNSSLNILANKKIVKRQSSTITTNNNASILKKADERNYKADKTDKTDKTDVLGISINNSPILKKEGNSNRFKKTVTFKEEEARRISRQISSLNQNDQNILKLSHKNTSNNISSISNVSSITKFTKPLKKYSNSKSMVDTTPNKTLRTQTTYVKTENEASKKLNGKESFKNSMTKNRNDIYDAMKSNLTSFIEDNKNDITFHGNKRFKDKSAEYFLIVSKTFFSK